MAPKAKADKKPAEKKPKASADKKANKKAKKSVETYKICASALSLPSLFPSFPPGLPRWLL